MKSTLKEVGDGVQDINGEHRATEKQLVTPGTSSVARYIQLSWMFGFGIMACGLTDYLTLSVHHWM